MRIWKRILMEIVRRPFRAVTLAIMILALSILSMIGVFLNDVVKTAYQEYVKIDGYSIAIENRSDEQQAVPKEICNKILALDHIVGYNNNSNLDRNYKPVNFINVPYEKSDSTQSDSTQSDSTQSDVQEDITLCGDIDTSLYSTFRNGNMIIVEGVYPNTITRGVLIDSILASKNGLTIGDNIDLYRETDGKTVVFKIIGIYETIDAPEVGVSSDLGTYYTVAASSYIFCDYDSYIEMTQMNDDTSSLKFFVDKYENIDEAFQKIKEMVSKDDYNVVNCLENALSYYGTVIVTLKNTANSLLRFTYITSLSILFLMTLLWMRDHYYEAGIYIALGTGKLKIVLYFVLEILAISVTSLGVSLLIGRGVVFTYKEQLLKMALGFTNSKFLDRSVQAKVIESAFSYRSLLYGSMNYLIIVLVATLLSSFAIIRYNPRKLFAER